MEQLRSLLDTGAGDDMQEKVSQINGAAAALENAQTAATFLGSVQPDGHGKSGPDAVR